MRASILDLFYLCMSTLDMFYMYTATQNCDTYNERNLHNEILQTVVKVSTKWIISVID